MICKNRVSVQHKDPSGFVQVLLSYIKMNRSYVSVAPAGVSARIKTIREIYNYSHLSCVPQLRLPLNNFGQYDLYFLFNSSLHLSLSIFRPLIRHLKMKIKMCGLLNAWIITHTPTPAHTSSCYTSQKSCNVKTTISR